MSYVHEIPFYDFRHPVFQVQRKFIGWAREHQALAALRSNVIRWEVKQTITPLQIPTVYHVHYHIKSIVGIDEVEQPLYGNHHILEISLPVNYPIQPFTIRMITDVWHPNIRSDGPFKGRVCGNIRNLGRMYDLYQLVLRIGEILQYKNYHAENTPPFPEDARVAQWVLNIAEPRGVVNKHKEIYVDNTPLVADPDEEESTAPESPASTPLPETANETAGRSDQPGQVEKRVIIIGKARKSASEEAPPFRHEIKLKKRDPDA